MIMIKEGDYFVIVAIVIIITSTFIFISLIVNDHNYNNDAKKFCQDNKLIFDHANYLINDVSCYDFSNKDNLKAVQIKKINGEFYIIE